ncbi:MAG: hypothetical protein ACRBHB_08270 [Arenicella sp.]
MLKKILLLSAILFSANAYSANYIDTQYGENGMEVHIMKVSFNKNIMTVVFAVENTSDEDAVYSAFPIQQVYFNTGNKKYPVIKDAEDRWLASTIAYTNSKTDIFADKLNSNKYYTFTVKAGGKKVGWMKYEAPQDSDWPLDLSFPGVTPFTINKPQ